MVIFQVWWEIDKVVEWVYKDNIFQDLNIVENWMRQHKIAKGKIKGTQ